MDIITPGSLSATSAERAALYPWDCRVLPIPSNRKGARDDYKLAVPRDDFAFVGNAGIMLDEQYLAVDFDAHDPLRVQWTDALPPTWTQATPHGEHRLYRVPAEWAGHNVKIVSPTTRRPIGDVKAHGYIIGPGSRFEVCPSHPSGCGRARDGYEVVDARDPADAPTWLLEYAAASSGLIVNGEVQAGGVDLDGVPPGQHDDALHRIGSYLRGRLGFSEEAIARQLQGMVASGFLEGVDPSRPYTENDFRRLARQAARYPGAEPTVKATALVCGTDVELVGPMVRWWKKGFVPQAELVMLYGKGGTGKSSWGSWLAAEVTRQKGKFLFVGVEEPFQRFLFRAVLGGADRSLIYSVAGASRLSLPGAVKELREEIEALGIGVVYFDSIYSHFEQVPNSNVAERARRCLGPLSEMASATGCTVVGVFHENKMGDFLGSVEMVNVARYVLRARREKGVAKLRIEVDKTNIWDPECILTYTADDRECRDGEAVQWEEGDDGDPVPMKMKVLVPGEDERLDVATAGQIPENDSEPIL